MSDDVRQPAATPAAEWRRLAAERAAELTAASVEPLAAAEVLAAHGAAGPPGARFHPAAAGDLGDMAISYGKRSAGLGGLFAGAVAAALAAASGADGGDDRGDGVCRADLPGFSGSLLYATGGTGGGVTVLAVTHQRLGRAYFDRELAPLR